jgi:hypothetical protein
MMRNRKVNSCCDANNYCDISVSHKVATREPGDEIADARCHWRERGKDQDGRTFTMDDDRRLGRTDGFADVTVTRRATRKASGRPDLDAMLWHLMERAMAGQLLSRDAMEDALLQQAVIGAAARPRPRATVKSVGVPR